MTRSIAPDASATRSKLLADLLERVTAGVRAGEPADFDRLLAEYPEHAEELRRLLPAVQFLADLSGSVDAGTFPPAEGVAGLSHEPLGDFRLIREVGRGGMGVVYEAEQMSLGRRVALKVLPFAATMDPRHLQRFHNEAKAAASLHHEHIVPVYGVGCERGVHYYAMQFIDGTTLAAVIDGFRSSIDDFKQPNSAPCPGIPIENRKSKIENGTPAFAALSTKHDRTRLRTIAALIADAADALEYAHSTGIVHRDVKPGNLLLDAAGKIWVADFGLARFGADADLTMSGDLLGTLRYMAPEQALAKHGLVDHRADVYGLGCTLYELLTGRTAVAGEDKQEILRHIAFEEPVAPRKLDKSIPAELETIALKCLAKEPTERYATAGEAANDLRRFVVNKPILAQPASAPQWLWKWARRHVQFVALTLTFLFLIVIGLAAGLAIIWGEQEQTKTALKEARDQRDRAEANGRRAMDGARYVFAAGCRPEGAPQITVAELRREQADLTLEFYRGFMREDSTVPSDRLLTGLVHVSMANVYHLVGDRPRTEESLTRCQRAPKHHQ